MADKSKHSIEDKKGEIKNEEKKDQIEKQNTIKKNKVKKKSAKQSKKAVDQTTKTGKTADKKEEKKKDDIVSPEEKAAIFQDKYLRLSADFDNKPSAGNG